MSTTDYDAYCVYVRCNYNDPNIADLEKNSTVDAIINVSTSNFDNSHLMIVSVLPVYKKLIRKGQTLIEGHSFLNRSHECYAIALKIELDATKQTHVAEFLIRQDIRIPAYLTSCGIGSFVMSRLTDWGKSLRPNAIVKPIALLATDPTDKNAHIRRKNFFRKHGFECVFDQAAEQTGWAKANTLGQLRSAINEKKIQKLESTTQEIAAQMTELAEARMRSRSLREVTEMMRKRIKTLADQRNMFILIMAFALLVNLAQWMA